MEKFHGDCTADGTYDADGVQVTSGMDARGREVPDPVPLAPPVGMSQADTLIEMVRRSVRQHFSLMASEQGFETFEEAEDFDIEDDPLDPHTPYEAVFDPPATPLQAPVGPLTNVHPANPAVAATQDQALAGAGGPPPVASPPAGAPLAAEK